MRLVHDHGHRALPAASIRLSRFSPRTTRPPCRRAFRKRRGLSGTNAPGSLQLVFQPRILAFESPALPFDTSPLRFGSFKLATQPRILSPQILDWLRRPPIGAWAHAPLMPEFPSQYKSGPVVIALEKLLAASNLDQRFFV
jgi:hypothetical protein